MDRNRRRGHAGRPQRHQATGAGRAGGGEELQVAPRLALGRGPDDVERASLERFTQRHGLANTCRVILNLVEAAETDVAEERLTPRGNIRISLPLSFGLKRLAPLLLDFSQRHPEVALDMDYSDRRVNLIEEGIALRFGGHHHLMLAIGELDELAFGPSGHPVTDWLGFNNPFMAAQSGKGGQVGRGQGAHLEAIAQRSGDPSAGRACDCQGGLFDEMGNHHRPHIRRARQKIIRESRSMNVRAAIGSRRIGGAQRRVREGICQRAEDFRGGQADAEHRRGEGGGFEARRAIGERGREVKEFVEDILGAQDRGRAVVVAAPADAPPLLRMQGAAYATAVAEHFRDKGKHVLLLMDSLTRYAMAQREIALAIGEPPATKGYPPSCFAKLPQLVERSGNGLHGVGSITAFYTVLSEGDDQQDPIADAARAILDGHIVLSRALAETGHFPAIDIEQSASRVMHNVVSQEHFELARQFRAVYSRYQKSRDLVQVGAYMSGSDPALDEAIRLQPQMAAFLQQDMFEAASMDQSVTAMASVLDR